MRDDWDDERLLVALGEAIKASQAVPAWFVETGKNAFAWHNIDAELAQLTYDSNEDKREAAVMRSEKASIRALTFTSAHLSLELEVTENSLLGQIIPPRAGTLEIHTRAGEVNTTEMDEIGCFAIDPIPDSPFRLRCRTADGTDVLTGWITISPASSACDWRDFRPRPRRWLRPPRTDLVSVISRVHVSDRDAGPPYQHTSPRASGGTRGLAIGWPAGYQDAVGAPVRCGAGAAIRWARAWGR